MKKRGLSEVIVSLIILLLVLVAIGIIWVVVKNILVSSSEKVTIDSLTNNIKIDEARVELKAGIPTASVKITRTSGNANLTSMKFLFTDGTKTYEYEQKTNLPQTLETKTYPIEIPTSKGITPTSVTVIPIFGKQNGLENKKDITADLSCTTNANCQAGYICDAKKCHLNLVKNGNFDGASSWNYNPVCGYGTLSATCTIGTSGDFQQNIGVITGREYRLIYKLTFNGAGPLITPQIGEVSGTQKSTSGTFTEEITASTNGNLIFSITAGSLTSGTSTNIDDVSVYEV